MTTLTLLDAFRRRGITLSAVEGKLQVRPASALTAEDRTVIRQHLTELVALLVAGPSPVRGQPATARDTWDQQVALQLMDEADGLMERLGVDGRHPTVSAAAGRALAAHAAHDMNSLRFAVSDFVAVVRRVWTCRT